jgi:hypothetical protein
VAQDIPLALGSNINMQLRVNTVHEKGTIKYTQQDSLDETGGRLNYPRYSPMSNF